MFVCPQYAEILGGGFPLGSLVMVMEDAEAPHHMLLLRNFMSQGLVHNQPLLYASPSKDPRGFLGTLPSPSLSKDGKSRNHDPEQVILFFQFTSTCYFLVGLVTFFVKKNLNGMLNLQEKGLRIAWQYKKYFSENQQNFDSHKGIFFSAITFIILLSHCRVLLAKINVKR